jgi:putative phage-type endonuclease
MTLIVCNAEQGTPEWLADRLGKATGSKADTILAKGRTKGTESKTRTSYIYQLALERITGKTGDFVKVNEHMTRGTALEPEARALYEMETGNLVEQIGFAYIEGAMFGCSVDGFIDDRKGIIEIKAPIHTIHWRYIERGEPPADYIPQMTHNLFVTGARYCDFVSYCEFMPPKLRLFVVRYQPSAEILMSYGMELIDFLREVDDLEMKIKLKAA